MLKLQFQIIVESEKEEETDDDEATVEDAPDESEEVEIPEVKVNPQPAQPTRDAQSFETQGEFFEDDPRRCICMSLCTLVRNKGLTFLSLSSSSWAPLEVGK